MSLSFRLSKHDQEFLSRQARRAIQTRLDGDEKALPEKPDKDSVLEKTLGSFVTLRLGGDLRGCIGTIVAREPLWLNVWEMARAAAFQDPRFKPLNSLEWPGVNMEISVLDEPTPCPDPAKIVVGRDGLILNVDGRTGVFLPQVATEQGWTLEEYLNHLCLKAGVAPGAWQRPEARLFRYQAFVFPA